jgi:hypothetical protein
MKLKFIRAMLLCAVAVAMVTGCTTSTNTGESADFVQGNTAGNLHADGLVVSGEDGWVYFSNIDDNGYLYKKELTGGEQALLVDGHFACELNLVNGWIYYTAGIPGEVYKVGTNGENDRKIISKHAGNLIVTNQYIFYRLSYDDDWGKLFRTDLEGTHEVLLADSIVKFAITDGWIYYSNREDNERLYKMDFNGRNKTKLNDIGVSEIDVSGDYIFYVSAEDGQNLYRVKTDGTEKVLLSDEICWEINIYGDFLYYRNQSRGGRVFKMKLDGSQNKVLIDEENCGIVAITEDYLFYQIPVATQSGQKGYFIADLDGGYVKRWMKEPD